MSTSTLTVPTTRSSPTASWSSKRVSVRTSTMLASAASLAHWLANCRLRGRICLITRQVLAAPLPGAGSRSDDVPNMCQRHLFLSLSSFIHLLLFFFFVFLPPYSCPPFIHYINWTESFSLRVFPYIISLLLLSHVTRSQQISTAV